MGEEKPPEGGSSLLIAFKLKFRVSIHVPKHEAQ